ncbi:hypothetical protein Bbelb_156730 [Branchiostoma belcheri]|nr:hypothetical protein Bbelb_156730 [Branchiostoma belcheri]
MNRLALQPKCLPKTVGDLPEETGHTTLSAGLINLLHKKSSFVELFSAIGHGDDTKLMYYFDEKTMWTAHHVHSYNQERFYVRALSLTPEEDIEDTGVVLLKGFTQTQCG